MSSASINRLITDRDQNVIRVDFRRNPDQPHPRFPGGAAARPPAWLHVTATIRSAVSR